MIDMILGFPVDNLRQQETSPLPRMLLEVFFEFFYALVEEG